jgi:hypothetical protein
VEYGIPQGSCISPELFEIATLDLCHHLSCAVAIQYAYDINLSIAADSLEEVKRKTDITLTELQDWCKMKNIILNPKKSGYMLISKKKTALCAFDIQLTGHDVGKINCTKVLGVHIQDDLT